MVPVEMLAPCTCQVPAVVPFCRSPCTSATYCVVAAVVAGQLADPPLAVICPSVGVTAPLLP
jgi:hypothetical protein